MEGVNGQGNARIGMYFNDGNECNSPDSGRLVAQHVLLCRRRLYLELHWWLERREV